jgi:hypothetical protein
MADYVLVLDPELVTMSEVFSNQAQKLAEESVTPTDSALNRTGVLAAETCTLSGGIVRDSRKRVSQTISLSEVFAKKSLRTLTQAVSLNDSQTTIKVYMTVKFLMTDASNVETDLAYYINQNIEPGNLKALNVVPISSSNFGVLITHS